jgi:phosphoribosylcarboxyaminoimidazole (NCAIR) mutase
MPGGIPVATVAIGSGGAVNAALLAVEILALSDPALRVKMHQHKKTMAEKVMKADAELQKSL